MGPLVFTPYFRPQIWGGRRLQELLGKPLPPQGTFGESWEVSAHPLHVSRVAEGAFQGMLLTELCAKHPRELFGEQVPPGFRFPLLIKILDCRDWLSVQVHPDDVAARRLLGQECGKTEAWVILEVGPGGLVYAGFLPGTTCADVERHLREGTIDHCLCSFVPRPGDCLFLPAGTPHSVGGGVVLAEVQQSSDANFRLFDWNRLGQNGRPRPLHVREALVALDWSGGPVQPVRGTSIGGLPAGVSGEHLVRCPFFHLSRFHLERPFPVPYAGRLSVWMVLEGAATLHSPVPAPGRLFHQGDSVLVPASAEGPSWEPAGQSGDATLLAINLS